MLTCKIEWKLYNLEMHREFLSSGKYFSSKQFYNTKCPSVVWELRIYPNMLHEYRQQRGRFGGALTSFTTTDISLIQMGLIDYHDKLRAKFNIYALNVDGVRVDICSDKFDFQHGTQTPKYQIDMTMACLLEGFISLVCEVEFVPYNVNVELADEHLLTVNTLQKSIKNMFKQGTFSDCVIEIGDDKINAHRCILAQNSQVFFRMFEQKGMVEAQKGVVKIVDASPECFRLMLEYFYSGELDKTIFEKHVEDLFAIAHKYEVVELIEKCDCFMALKIDAESFVKRCEFAELYDLPVLEKACVKFMSLNRKDFLFSNEWKEFKIANPTLAHKMLEMLAVDC